MPSNPTDALVAGCEQYLSELTADEFQAVVSRVRPPDDTPTDGLDPAELAKLATRYRG